MKYQMNTNKAVPPGIEKPGCERCNPAPTGSSFTVTIRFYDDLNDFLRKDSRQKDLIVQSKGRRSIKDLVESLGVPHVEIGLILVNGKSVDFSHIIRQGDRISVYPEFREFDISGVTRIRPRVPGVMRFILDVHLRRLARLLRLLGFDVDYRNDRDDPELAEISHRQQRILLTRDRQLLKRNIVDRGFFIRNTDPTKQAREVLQRLDLWSLIRPFTRCIECNSMIEALSVSDERFKEEKHRIPKGTVVWCREFYICNACGRIYWKGSHYDRLQYKIDRIREQKDDTIFKDG